MTCLFVVAAHRHAGGSEIDLRTRPARADHRPDKPGSGGGGAGVPGRNGAGDGHQAPATAIAQLGSARQPRAGALRARHTRLDDRDRRRADHRRSPPSRSSLTSESRSRQHPDRRPGPRGRRGAALFAFFHCPQPCSCSPPSASSFQAGPGLLQGARPGRPAGPGLLPRPPSAASTRHHTPVRGVVVYVVISAVVLVAAGGQEQELVLVYAVAVFVSLSSSGLLAMARFSFLAPRRASC